MQMMVWQMQQLMQHSFSAPQPPPSHQTQYQQQPAFPQQPQQQPLFSQQQQQTFQYQFPQQEAGGAQAAGTTQQYFFNTSVPPPRLNRQTSTSQIEEIYGNDLGNEKPTLFPETLHPAPGQQNEYSRLSGQFEPQAHSTTAYALNQQQSGRGGGTLQQINQRHSANKLFDVTKVPKYTGEKDYRNPKVFLRDFEQLTDDVRDDMLRARMFSLMFDQEAFPAARSYPYSLGYLACREHFLRVEWTLLNRQREREAVRNSTYDPKKHQSEADYLIDCFTRLFETDLCSCQELCDILKPKTPVEMLLELRPDDYKSVLQYATKVRQHKSAFKKPNNFWSNNKYQDAKKNEGRGRTGHVGFAGEETPDGEEISDEQPVDPSGNE